MITVDERLAAVYDLKSDIDYALDRVRVTSREVAAQVERLLWRLSLHVQQRLLASPTYQPMQDPAVITMLAQMRALLEQPSVPVQVRRVIEETEDTYRELAQQAEKPGKPGLSYRQLHTVVMAGAHAGGITATLAASRGSLSAELVQDLVQVMTTSAGLAAIASLMPSMISRYSDRVSAGDETVIMDHIRDTAQAAAGTSPWVWVSKLDAEACRACVGLHGSRHPASESFSRGHPRCRCLALPVVTGEERVQLTQQRDRFLSRLSQDQLRSMLGVRGAELYRDGTWGPDDWYRRSRSSGELRYTTTSVKSVDPEAKATGE